MSKHRVGELQENPAPITGHRSWSFWLVYGVISVSWLLFSASAVSRIFAETAPQKSVLIYISIITALLVIVPTVLYVWRELWRDMANSLLARHTQQVDSLPQNQVWFWTALAAGIGLFAELMLIRVHSSYFQLFAYFKNVSLLSCFLGLGVGYLRGSKSPLLTPIVLPLLAFQIVLLLLFRSTIVAEWLNNPVTEQFTFGIETASGLGHLSVVYGFLVFIFAVNALSFIPLGQIASRLMSRQESLRSYGWNLIGSLAGIVIFSIMAFAWAPPWVWVAALAVGLLSFMYKQLLSWILTAVVASVLCIMLVTSTPAGTREIYSPYQILNLVFSDNAPTELLACNTYHQKIIDLSDSAVYRDPTLQQAADYYGMPYSFFNSPQDVLIVGSGTGNDVAAAIRAHAASIDAVEIDPAILSCGIEYHPEHPYDATKVTAIVDDARSHLRHTIKQYDLIVYGLLDSHSLLSGKSGGVRLDSYVYTVEGFRDARRRLKPGGAISLSFCVMKKELGRKLFLMLQKAFDGKTPLVFESQFDGSTCFLIGEQLTKASMVEAPRLREITAFVNDSRLETDVSTDDWPFFYMAKRQYPLSYIAIILALACVSWLFVRQMTPLELAGFSMPCFFLGAGFMLIETKSITELALVYGSTWIVVSVVIASIMVMAFSANFTVARFGAPRPLRTYVLLGMAILLGMGLSLIDFQSSSAVVSKILMTLTMTLPLFFSGIAFSSALKKAPSIGIAFSSNLLGAMLGGFLEYNAMYFGYQSLYILALVMYALAFIGTVKADS